MLASLAAFFALSLASCDLLPMRPPSDPSRISVIAPEDYSSLGSWTRGTMEELDDEAWYYVDSTAYPGGLYLHWVDVWDNGPFALNSSTSADIWVTVYDEDMEEVASKDNGYSDAYTDTSGNGLGVVLASRGRYYVKVSQYDSYSLGDYWLCAVHDIAAPNPAER